MQTGRYGQNRRGDTAAADMRQTMAPCAGHRQVGQRKQKPALRRGKNIRRKVAVLLACLLLMTGCGAGTGSSGSSSEGIGKTGADTKTDPASAVNAVLESAEEVHHARINVEGYGTITVALVADAAPATVDNFVTLARDGFYDGLTFHRIIDGFMIQGGDPNGNGTGGSGQTIVGEFSSNGHENPISHVKGVISMARAQDPDSASSQFFITVADATFLDGEYAAFGYVTEGMDIAEQIAKDAEPVDGNGTIPAGAQPVISSIVVTD